MSGEPLGYGGEGCRGDERRDVLLGPGFEGLFDAVFLVGPPFFG